MYLLRTWGEYPSGNPEAPPSYRSQDTYDTRNNDIGIIYLQYGACRATYVYIQVVS